MDEEELDLQKRFRQLKNRVNRARRDFAMFDRHQRLLLAVSGGKDSLILALILKALNQPFEVLHIDLGIERVSEESGKRVEAFCKQNRIEYSIVKSRDYLELEVDRLEMGTKTCAICGTIKRRIFNQYAHQHGFSVLAVAHNLDDEVAMLFANNRQWQFDYLKKSLPVLDARAGFVKRVKPLCYCREADLKAYAQASHLAVVRAECSYSSFGSRLKYNRILAQAEKELPGFVQSYYHSFIRQADLIKKLKDQNAGLKACSKCGEMSSSEPCRLCRVKAGVWAD